MHVPEVSSFEYADGDSELVSRAHAGASEAEIVDAYQSTALPFVMQARGDHEALHASAVESRLGSIVGICGPSESGKSTIAFAFAARGLRQWADDALVVRVGDPDGIHVVSLPFKPKLRENSANHFRDHDARSLQTSAHDAEAPLGGVFVIESQRGDDRAACRIEQLNSGEALKRLLPHAFRFRPDTRERRRRMLSAYLDLVRDVPVWHLRYPVGLEHLDGVLAAIDRRIA